MICSKQGNIRKKIDFYFPNQYKGSESYSIPIKSGLQDNNIEMHSAHNEGKSFVAEKFVKSLKNKT